MNAPERPPESAEARFERAMAGSDEAHWDWNIVTGEQYVSPRLFEMYGLPFDPSVATRAAFLARFQPCAGDRCEWMLALDEHVAGRTPRFELEYRILRPDGELRWLHDRGQCFRDANGQPRYVAGSTSDVTERKRAEEALRASEERFALAVAGSNDGIWDWDIANDRMFASERNQRLLGIDPPIQELLPRREWHARVAVHPDDRARYDADFQSYLDGHTSIREGEYRFRRADDGTYRWLRVRGLCIRDANGTPIRIAGSMSDIDAQKRTEEALRLSEERYQLAVAGSNEGLWDWDMPADHVFLAPRAQALMGWTPGEPLRPRRYWLNRSMYHPEDVPRVRAAISAHLKGQTKHFAVEYRMRHSTGDWHWYRQRGVAIRDASGRAYRMAGSMEDITERKRTEIAKEALETQLRQAQKLEAMGTLAGGIAHDFNNILAAILGYGEMAQKRLEEGTAVRQHVDSVMSAGLRAKSLVERILAFSRSGIGDRVPVHAQSTVGEALDLVAASIPAGVRLERDLDCGDAAVIGDPTQLHQVVVNLATNAIQAIKSQGTVRVSLATVALTTPQHVCTTTIAPGAYVCLTVADSGAGIAPEIIERIFDPFFTTKQFGIGTGLGLSLVHGIVTDLGGGIGVESRLDAGTTFLVYLPVRGTTVPARQVVDTVPNGEGQTILVVDDEEALVRLSEEMLAGIGYEPVCFTSAARALERFRADPQRFDAVVTDEMMPGMTGSELARAIRAIRADIPIVLVSGYLSPLVLARVKAAGVAEVLAKPLVSRDIAKSLARVLRPTPPRAAAVGE